jgi:hypothetical protein
VFLPTQRVGTAAPGDPIRLKNLLREAEQQLAATGMRPPEVRKLLQPATAWLQDGMFWRYQGEGLAVFAAPGHFEYYRLPAAPPELLVVSGRFHIKPLLHLLVNDGQFYILALSQNRVRLLQGSRFAVTEVDLEGVPASLEEALGEQEQERQLQFRTHVPRGKGRRAALFHGHGVGKDDAKDQIRRYFRLVDAGLTELLHGQRTPLVLAGVDYLLPIYREASDYPHLVKGGVTGNPEELGEKELHAQAWALVEPGFRAARAAVLDQYRQLAGTGRTADQVSAIVPAAYHGRVEDLVIPVGRQEWGRFDPDTGEVAVHPQPRPGDEDLLDLAAFYTLLNGGSVYTAGSDAADASLLPAAVLRY